MCRHWRVTGLRAAVVTSLAISLLLGLAVPASAGVDETRRRKAQADAQARQAAKRVDDLSRQLHSAVQALAAVRGRIPAAQARVSRVRGTLAAARARDVELARQLAVTRAAAQQTRAEIAATQGRMRESQRMVGRIARTAYQGGELSEWSTVLGAQTPLEMASRLAMLRSTSQAEADLLSGLGDDRANLAAFRASLRARAAKEGRLKAAQEALVRRIEALEREAVAAAARLQVLARARGAAAAQVRTQRAAERARYARAVAESRALALRIAAQRRAAERRLAAQRRREAARRADQGHPATPSAGAAGGGQSGLLWPAPGPITTYAGPRINPVTGARSCHAGIDVAAGYGSVIRAMARGVVVATSVNAWDGLTTIVAHGGGMTTWYAHQSRFGVRPGQSVARGQVIGYVGSSGFSTGPHLHFNLAINEVAYDPMGWFGGPRRTVASMCPDGPAPVL